MAEAVIGRALFAVLEDVVGLVQFLEARLGVLVPVVAVGVVVVSASAVPAHPARRATPTTDAAAKPVRSAPAVRGRATAVVRIMMVLLLSCRPRARWRPHKNSTG